ncbi:hypothetical protein HIM_05874 [Hirsutella minnesotensis 3608]|uniref:Rhodopsin domain-containing protein n=1 Tax=Hirsutella minnesotensis 3608 TaxID=1043627 RepID=A0A0F7ZZT2_9HYPO|nr:hypothetical protein HIM_05874 [Hirsutella minnesotensis 3608]
MSTPRTFNAEIFALFGTGLATVVIRLFVRPGAQAGIRFPSLDDGFVAVATVFFIVETLLAYFFENEAHGLTNSYMSPDERAALVSQPGSREAESRILGSKLQLGSWTSHSVVVWFLKAAVCCIYLRLANRHHGEYRPAAFVGFVLLAASWLGASLNLVLSCRPLPHMWQVDADPGPFCQPATSPALIWTYMSLGLFTYVYLLLVPMPVLFRAAVPKRHKLLTVALMGCGYLAAFAAINRAVVVSQLKDIGLGRRWEIRESFAMLFTANMATVLPRLMAACSREAQPNPVNEANPRISRAARISSFVFGDDKLISFPEVAKLRERSVSDPESLWVGEGKDEVGIQLQVDVLVEAQNDLAAVESGNYTGVWSGDKGGHQVRSKYFGDDIPRRSYAKQ